MWLLNTWKPSLYRFKDTFTLGTTKSQIKELETEEKSSPLQWKIFSSGSEAQGCSAGPALPRHRAQPPANGAELSVSTSRAWRQRVCPPQREIPACPAAVPLVCVRLCLVCVHQHRNMKENNRRLQKEEAAPWLSITSHIKPCLAPNPRLGHGCPTSLPREARLPQAGQHQRDTTEALTPHAVGLEQLQSSGKHQLTRLSWFPNALRRGSQHKWHLTPASPKFPTFTWVPWI